jgi:hypothetical protein
MRGQSYGIGGMRSGGLRGQYHRSNMDPDVAELEKAQELWYSMSPEERLALVQQDRYPRNTSIAGGLIGGLGGLGLSGLIRPSAAGGIGLLGMVGGGVLGHQAGKHIEEEKALERLVPVHHAYDLAREQIANEVAEKAAAVYAPPTLPIEELRALARKANPLQAVGGHALAGAGLGALTGGLVAEDDTLSGASRGALAGALAGTALGGLNQGLAHLRGINPEIIARHQADVGKAELAAQLASRSPTYNPTAVVEALTDLNKARAAERAFLTEAQAQGAGAAYLNPLVTGTAGVIGGKDSPPKRTNLRPDYAYYE